MDFYEVVKQRRSVRKFEPSEISEEALMRILEAGRCAPTGCNLQTKEFILIRDRSTLEQLHDKVQPDFKNAAAAIAVVMDPTQTARGSYWVEDAAAAVENMLLAISYEGYASVWVEGALMPHEPWARELLNVPESKRLYVLLPIGKPAKEPRTPAKKELAEILHFEKYQDAKD